MQRSVDFSGIISPRREQLSGLLADYFQVSQRSGSQIRACTWLLKLFVQLLSPLDPCRISLAATK